MTFTGSREISKRRTNLNQFLSEFASLTRRLIREDIEIKVVLPAKEVITSVDPGLLEQALMNLVVNARDAMPSGGTLSLELDVVNTNELTLSSHKWLRNPDLYNLRGEYCVISVRDTGLGMDENTLRHAFEPFFTTKAPGEGTGLGLAMVDGIVRQHNGMTSCQSELGKGTVIHLFLPIEITEGEEKPLEETKDSLVGSGTVLVAEDEAIIRDLIERILVGYGYKVICFDNGEDLLKEFSRMAQSVTAVVLDVVMPKMSGIDCAREINRINPSTPILLMSGYTKEELKNEALPKDVGLLQKPFLPIELARKVKELTKVKR